MQADKKEICQQYKGKRYFNIGSDLAKKGTSSFNGKYLSLVTNPWENGKYAIKFKQHLEQKQTYIKYKCARFSR